MYYSNRSACYAGLRQWKEAADNAKDCIRLNPSFVKGYYRLGLALKELKEYTKATHAVQQGLAVASKEGGEDVAQHEPLHKLLRQLEQLQKASLSGNDSHSSPTKDALSPTTGAALPPSSYAQLDEASSRELQDLQEQATRSSRDLAVVENQLMRLNRDRRLAEVTMEEIRQLPADSSSGSSTNCYRSIGKIFLKSSHNAVMKHLQEEVASNDKKMSDLSQKKDYLKRRINSQQQNMKDILSSASS